MFIDTSFCIDLMREGRRSLPGAATAKLKSLGNTGLYLSLFSLCELRAGAELSKNPKRELHKVENMLTYVTVVHPDAAFAVIYGEMEAYLRKAGMPIPVMDLLIGCSVKIAGMPIITRATIHFERIPGVIVESY
jgi:predicted nucleic acid-binding protein